MSVDTELRFEALALSQFAKVHKKLPDGYDTNYVVIPARRGFAFRVTSFTDSETTYRVAVECFRGQWMGKCECGGWPRTKSTREGKKPCVHIAGALLCTGEFDPEVYLNDEPKTDESPPETTSPRPPADEPPPIDATGSGEDSPFVDAVPDAIPYAPVPAVGAPPVVVASLVAPVATIQEARKVFKAFQEAKLGLLDKSDVQPVADRSFIKKSGWRKIAVFFGVSCQKLAEGVIESPAGRVYYFTYRAQAPNGQFQDATGYCSWDESNPAGTIAAAERKAKEKVKKGTWSEARAEQHISGTIAKLEHDVRATAETRAKNRAIADLVGGGEVTAEEMRMVGAWRQDE